MVHIIIQQNQYIYSMFASELNDQIEQDSIYYNLEEQKQQQIIQAPNIIIQNGFAQNNQLLEQNYENSISNQQIQAIYYNQKQILQSKQLNNLSSTHKKHSQVKLQKIYQPSKLHILIKQVNLQTLVGKQHILDQHLCRIRTKLQNPEYQQNSQQYQHLKCNAGSKNFQQVIPIGRIISFPINFINIDSSVVSREHCKIQNIPNDMQPLCKKFVNFLGCRKFCDEYNPLYNLQNGIIKKIFQYARNPYGYHLIDMQSRNGTFVKIKEQTKIKNQDIFSLGQVYKFQIKQIFQANSSLKVEQHNQKFFQTFIKHQQQSPLIKLIGNFDFFHENQKYYWIKISVEYEQQTTDYIISSSLKEIKIGLNQDINIDDPSISYYGYQCKILFKKNNWYLCEGNSHIHTTWLKLKPHDPYKLSNHEIIKLAMTNQLQFNIVSQQILKYQMNNQ